MRDRSNSLRIYNEVSLTIQKRLCKLKRSYNISCFSNKATAGVMLIAK